MTKEHKKMYKAGKNWIAATITVATVAVFGGLATLNAHADSTTQVQKINSSITNQNPTNVTTQGSQINNVNEKQSVNNSKSISQADRYNLTTAGSNNQSSENSNSNLQFSMSNGSQTATATLTHTKNSDGLDPNIYGTVNVSDWDYINNNSMIHITDYHGNDYQHIVVPNLNDFSNAGMNIDGIDGVGITSGVIHNILSKISNSKPDTTFAISRTTGAYNDKVVAENADWAGAFCPHSLEYKDGHYIIKYDHHLPFKLTSVDVSNLDTHNITDMAAMFAIQDHLKVLTGLDSWDTSNVTNMSLMFESKWNTSNVTKNLQSVVDLSKWNTSKVTNMSGMFGWTNLQSVGDLSKWDTSNVTDMGAMFYQAENLQSVGDLSKWDTSKVTNMSGMFEWTNLQSVGDLSKWDTSKVTNMSGMFEWTNLQSVGDLSKWNTSNVTNMAVMFYQAENLQSVGDLSKWDTSKVTNMSGMFGGAQHLQTVGNIGNWDTSNVTDMSDMFDGAQHLQTVGNIGNWDTSKVTNMAAMFDYAENLQPVGDLSKWDTSNVTDMSGMFGGAQHLQTVGNIGNWDTSKVTNMSGMFEWTNLQSVGDLSKWDTSKVTNMSGMFEWTNLQSVGDLSKWNTSNVTNMSLMFESAENLQSVGDLSKWDTSKVTNMAAMFANTINLQSVGDLSKWDTSRVTDMSNVLSNSKINYFVVSRYNNSFNNILHLIDSNGLMGQPGETIATIKAPTFYKLETDGNKNASVYDTVFPLVQKKANEEYEKFLNGLTAGMRNIYPTKVSLKWVLDRGQVPTPVDNANATFTYNMKLGTLKDVVLNYVDKTGGVIGNIVGSEILTGTIGSTIPLPKKLSLPSGYQLVNGQDIPTSVTVEKGKLQTIEIYVEKESESPVVQKGSINYVDQNGKVIKTDTISGKVGDRINVKVSLPDGYELANKDEQIPSSITVGEDGIKTITIQVKKLPAVKTGSINYVDQDGKVIKTDTISGKVGDKVDVKLSLPDGYELANKDEQVPSVITVTENGIGTINVNVKKINTTLANNEVPYDSTTISNNVNANYGHLDSYKLTENNQGQAQLIASGWHATGASNSDRYRYMIVFDNTLGHEIARQKLVPQVRSDVQRAYPNVDNSLYSGFNITIDIPNSCINHSLRLVSRYSNDPNNGEGARVDYWFNSLALNEDNQAYLDKLSANGDTLTVTGWHASNQAAGRPYHYIIAWDQNLGHEIARQKVNPVSRPDVANAYSTVANAVNSGFSVKFNLTPEFFNDNIQFISRWTDDTAGNGNAVDYWFKAMNRENRANLDSVTLSNGQLQVAGWHATDLSQLEPNHYLIVFDNTTGQQVASEKVGLQSSQDVKNAFGDIQTANHSRFNYTFNSLHLIPGHNYSLVSRYSVDSNGNGNDGAHTDSWLNMGTFQQSAYSIDHVALNRRHMTVQGWVANDNVMTRPYTYAILLQNGHEIGRQRLNLSERDDVAKVYPQIYRSQYSGFSTSFDLPTASTNGLQLVLRFTDDPAGNGNSSDNWINL